KNIASIDYSDRSDSEKSIYGRTVGMRYAMQIMHDEDKLGLPWRNYIWKGGQEPDQVPQFDSDGEMVVDSEGNPVMVQNPSAGQDWCFSYGERSWLTEGSLMDAKLAASNNDVFGNP